MAEDPAGDNPVDEAERPGWLPEKFKSPEAMANSYTELERRLTEVSTNAQAYEQGYTELSAEIEQLRQGQTAPDPQDAQNWLAEQYDRDPLGTQAMLANQAAENMFNKKFQEFQAQVKPGQDGQLRTAAALADYELAQLAPDWNDYRQQVTEIISQHPHLVPEAHLSDPLALREDLMTVYKLARSADLEKKATEAEQRTNELLQTMKVNAQTMTGSQGRPMAPDDAKAEWDAIMNAKPGSYGS